MSGNDLFFCSSRVKEEKDFRLLCFLVKYNYYVFTDIKLECDRNDYNNCFRLDYWTSR